jgi:hypothetical protein
MSQLIQLRGTYSETAKDREFVATPWIGHDQQDLRLLFCFLCRIRKQTEIKP